MIRALAPLRGAWLQGRGCVRVRGRGARVSIVPRELGGTRLPRDGSEGRRV